MVLPLLKTQGSVLLGFYLEFQALTLIPGVINFPVGILYSSMMVILYVKHDGAERSLKHASGCICEVFPESLTEEGRPTLSMGSSILWTGVLNRIQGETKRSLAFIPPCFLTGWMQCGQLL